ncbi:flavin reductase domain protein FMN-binding [Catenulispora acidiphila DSM 44928]|uniref:Flavin reductase domain protein FMN-binding n=1 Tax=Catenulispora acidiphila (strain DSM 44928 / JCM 14897 / NBRC 102108 / NRRL B-24433 / ID139908) TaxID=479433 RepID=C7PY55_CATAD|nr:flavin reductase family protein [Catenulispora acidiphila]ACU75345.1 flavin reductase domain protein FMN-binding [Catenulispora acidiphila DSM 44928]
MTGTVARGQDGAAFRAAMSRWASGVAVVTTRDAAGRCHGFTATSFTSVSLDPPMVLVCLDRAASCAEAFAVATTYAVHILHGGQEELARRFARKGGDKFADLPVRVFGTPVLPDSLAVLECRVADRFAAGDHTVLLGLVRRAESFAGAPLLYHDRAFADVAARVSAPG